MQIQGAGKARHIQERVGERHGKTVSVSSKIKDSEILTKAASGAGISRSLIRLGFEIRDKRLLQKKETKKL